MSGVLGQQFGRKYSRESSCVSWVKYSVSSCLETRHVKYVYDCEKPSLARRCMTDGRVNASERKIARGYSRRISAISHSQNAKGLVCGLSTRKISTPSRAQNATTSCIACHSARQSRESKSMG